MDGSEAVSTLRDGTNIQSDDSGEEMRIFTGSRNITGWRCSPTTTADAVHVIEKENGVEWNERQQNGIVVKRAIRHRIRSFLIHPRQKKRTHTDEYLRLSVTPHFLCGSC